MEPRIEKREKTNLVGNKVRMSIANNQTRKLWQSFMPRLNEIEHKIGTAYYSVEVYDDPSFFRNFNPNREFEKWAAIQVSEHATVPSEMEALKIPQGLYAVFHYKGKATEAQGTYQYIYGNWIPNSVYELDDRPHFALMGEKYKNDDPTSEEEIWIPIKKK